MKGIDHLLENEAALDKLTIRSGEFLVDVDIV